MSVLATEFTTFDAKMMARALTLASKGKYSTTPNPQVGCVVVDRNNQIVGEGFHQKAGEGHAEVNALRQAGTKSIGASVYVTLEPCAHYGKTPPCALALIDAKVEKVIIACCDPFPAVNGGGIKMLREAGIDVSVGLMQNEAQVINEAFFARVQNKRPFITVKLAASLDGKTALASGESQWITSVQSRADVQQYRASACAILTGADTVIADDPKLNVRPEELSETIAQQFAWRGKQPLRVITDSQNRLSSVNYRLFNDGQATLVYNSRVNENLASAANGPVYQQQISRVKSNENEYVDLHFLMADLADKGINHLWVEAGEKLSGALFDLGLVDRLVLYQAPKLLGCTGKSLTRVTAKNRLSEALCGEVISVCKVGPDIKTIVQFSHLNKTGN